MSTAERWPVRATDGHEYELLVEVPEAPRAVLLFACAMGVEASYYAPFAEAMGEAGIVLAMCDLRGHGTSSIRPSRGVDFGYRECIELDIPAAVDVVRARTTGLPLYVGGHSLGGQLMILHVAATRPDIAGMILVACAIPYFRNWQGRMRVMIQALAALFPVVGFVLGYVPGDRFGFGATEARTVMRDWSHNARTAKYEPIGSEVDYEAALHTLEVDLFTVGIDGDEMAPPNAVQFMFEKVPGARGSRVEAKLSERRPAAHMRWARDPSDVVQAISEWIAKSAPIG
ncbi:MAG: alpha/beta fold hydrolase [Polyangiales bacterium]